MTDGVKAITKEQDQELSELYQRRKSPATKIVYKNSLKRYMNFVKVTEVDSLLEIGVDTP